MCRLAVRAGPVIVTNLTSITKSNQARERNHVSMSTTPALSVKVILGSTRQGRFGDKPAHWILGEAARQPGVETELLDLRDHPLPFFDRPVSPVREQGVYPSLAVTRWAEQIAKADAYIVVSPEYNHGYSAVLKNAFDHIYPAWARK